MVVADPRSRGREPPDKISQELATLENAKESPSDLDTRVLEREAMLSRASKLGVAAVAQSICSAMDHTNIVELPWLHLWTGSNSRCG